jgi:hypothetical protein
MTREESAGLVGSTIRVLLALPLFVVGGFVVAGVLAGRPVDESPGAYSGGVTWVGIVSSGGREFCRAIPEDELARHRDTLRVRFALSTDDVARCRAAFGAYDAESGWPLELRERERRYPGYALEIESNGQGHAVEVRRFHGDAISSTTRYRVDGSGVPTDVRTSSTSGGAGAFAVGFGGGGGLLLWMLWAGFLGARGLVRRFGRSR